MKIIKPSVEFYGAVPTDYAAALRFIEKCGRVCYKSEDMITETSAEGFVQKLIKAGHLAMVEHSNFVVRAEFDNLSILPVELSKYLHDYSDHKYLYIGGNLTAWSQQSLIYAQNQVYLRSRGFSPADALLIPFEKTFEQLFELSKKSFVVSPWEICPHDEIPKELHRYSAKFICDRGVSHELVRHRPCSFAQESTRYVNYAGKDMEFIEPTEFADWSERAKDIFASTCVNAMESYHQLIYNQDLKPQQARAVLPNALKTEIVVTTDAAEWSHIKKLRTAKSAHPDMQRVMNMMPWDEII